MRDGWRLRWGLASVLLLVVPITAATAEEKPKAGSAPVDDRYFDLRSPIILSLDSHGHGNRILQIGLSLHMQNSDDAVSMKGRGPLVIDAVQVFVRSLPASETINVARLGTHREELLARINAALAPLKADELTLFQFQQQ